MRFFQFKLDEKVRPPRPQTGLDPERLKKIDRITRKLQSDPELVDEIFKQISTKAKDIEGNFINRFIDKKTIRKILLKKFHSITDFKFFLIFLIFHNPRF